MGRIFPARENFPQAIFLPQKMLWEVVGFSRGNTSGGNSQKPGNHPNFEKKKTLGVKRPFSDQLSAFWGILGAILGMAVTT